MSSPPVVEIVTITPGPELKADRSLIKPIADTLLAQPGCKKFSWGILEEDQNTAIIFIGRSAGLTHTATIADCAAHRMG